MVLVPPAPGSRIGPYEIVAPLRSGGMAALYLGRREGPGGFSKPVAIKVIHTHLAKDDSFVRMFLDEARLSARISDPNVVHVAELGEADGMLYLAMEYVLGTSLANLLTHLVEARRALSVDVACAIAMRTADGLHAAHELRDDEGRLLDVVHRDVSPQNVLVSRAGHVKLIDFGVAKARGRSQETEGGSLKGKLRYMSPEQAWGEVIDRRTDVYALGVVLWEMLTRQRLFAGDNEIEILERVREPQVRPPSRLARGIPEELDHVVLTALAPDRNERYATAQALRRAIGGACPAALRVEPGDIAALVESLVGHELERERELLSSFRDPGLTPTIEPERLVTAISRLTRDAEGVDPALDTTAAAAAASIGPGADATSVSKRRRRPDASEVQGGARSPSTSAAAAPDAAASSLGAPGDGSQAAAARGPDQGRWPLFFAGGLTLVALWGASRLVVGPTAEATVEVPPVTQVPAPSGPCADARRIEGEEGSSTPLALDTREARASFELPGIRNEQVPPAPQVILEYVVPGEGQRAVELSTVNPGTDARFDTLLAVFRGRCEDIEPTAAPDVSFDDQGREFRARGSVAVHGGDVLTLVVTGFGGDLSSRIDRGLVELDITSRPSTPPAINQASVLVAGNEILVSVDGRDSDGDAAAVLVRLFGAEDAPLDFLVQAGNASSGARPQVADAAIGDKRIRDLLGEFDRPVAGARSFSERATLRLVSPDIGTLALARTAEVTLEDAAGHASAALRVPVVVGTMVGPGARCDEARVCSNDLVCSPEARCVAGAQRTETCRNAPLITLEAGDDGTYAARIQDTIDPGPGLFSAQCLPRWTTGLEDVFRLPVPRGRWDLVATTDSEGTAGESRRNPDTVIYLRRDCLDAAPGSAPETWCNDDIAPGEGMDANQRSRVEIADMPGGDVFLFVELWGSALPDGVGERYELSLSLRPVLGRGDACDPAGERNRCGEGTCDVGSGRCTGS